MREAFLVISVHAGYLVEKLKKLGYKVFYIDNYNKNNLEKISKKHFLENFLQSIQKKYQLIKLIYGSGLEDKNKALKILESKTSVQGNNFNIFKDCNNIIKLKRLLNANGIHIPKTKKEPLKENIKVITKPFFSYGGLGVEFFKRNKKECYYQEFIPGETFSISFFIQKEKFSLLGFNKLFHLKNFQEHPFIHAGAMNISKIKESRKIKECVENFSLKLGLKGYNSIDFKIFKNKIFVIDINPRITSTFRIYNELYLNNLLYSQINLESRKIFKPKKQIKKFYGFVYMFSNERFKFLRRAGSSKNISDLPSNGEIVKKNEPIFTINCLASSPSSILKSLRKEINAAKQIYNCYDIDI